MTLFFLSQIPTKLRETFPFLFEVYTLYKLIVGYRKTLARKNKNNNNCTNKGLYENNDNRDKGDG